MSQSKRVFLSAEWRDLVMLNYAVEPDILERYVPSGTTLDSFEGRTYVSLVGFRFCRTKLFDVLAIPFHANFEEVNLRIYVRREVRNAEGKEVRRGVVFISEIVPRFAIAATARLIYGENYSSFPMRHRIETQGPKRTTEYHWRIAGQWCKLKATTAGSPAHPSEGSFEQFITEHYWGYSALRTGGSIEYHVSHVPWQVWSATEAEFEGDASVLYGKQLADVLRRRPDCAFVADGSAIQVLAGDWIR